MNIVLQITRILNTLPYDEIQLLYRFHDETTIDGLARILSRTIKMAGMAEIAHLPRSAWSAICKSATYNEGSRIVHNGSTDCGPDTWRIGNQIGAGEFGTVSMACCNNNCKYVIKTQNIKSDSNAEAEIEIQNILAQHGIAVPIVDSWRCGSNVVSVMKTLKRTVKQILLETRSEEEFMKSLDAYFDLLNRMHAVGYVHMDTHLDNCMVDENGDYYLIDFGLSEKISSNNEDEDHSFLMEEVKAFGTETVLEIQILRRNLAKNTDRTEYIAYIDRLTESYNENPMEWTTGDISMDTKIRLSTNELELVEIDGRKRVWISRWLASQN